MVERLPMQIHDDGCRLPRRAPRPRAPAGVCRRAALAEWREFSYDLRRNKGHDAWVCKWCIGHLTRALAFRAAARQP